jgi:hypothetical protein
MENYGIGEKLDDQKREEKKKVGCTKKKIKFHALNIHK